MHTLLALPCVLLGAFGYRLRGSSYFHALTGLGDFYARLLAYGATMGLTALAAGAPYWLALGPNPRGRPDGRRSGQLRRHRHGPQ
jgi:hypothetical protein